MIKFVFRRFSAQSQQGSLGSPSSERHPPEFGPIHHRIADLEQRLQRLKTAVTNLEQLQQVETPNPAAEQDLHLSAEELQHLQIELDSFERELAAQLFSWEQIKEPFWQAVRFGGAGVLLGWVLARLAG